MDRLFSQRSAEWSAPARDLKMLDHVHLWAPFKLVGRSCIACRSFIFMPAEAAARGRARPSVSAARASLRVDSVRDISGIDLGNRVAGKIASSAIPARIRN